VSQQEGEASDCSTRKQRCEALRGEASFVAGVLAAVGADAAMVQRGCSVLACIAWVAPTGIWDDAAAAVAAALRTHVNSATVTTYGLLWAHNVSLVPANVPLLRACGFAELAREGMSRHPSTEHIQDRGAWLLQVLA
jgi:hypothetical protein